MIQPKTIDVPKQVSSDSATLLNHLKQAELLLSECYTLTQKIKQDKPQNEQIAIDIADAWHYSREALSQLGSNQNETVLPNM